jgi:hypothetical protein
MLNMSRQEIINTRYGEMCDIISCFAIYNGATPAKKKKSWSIEEALQLR